MGKYDKENDFAEYEGGDFKKIETGKNEKRPAPGGARMSLHTERSQCGKIDKNRERVRIT